MAQVSPSPDEHIPPWQQWLGRPPETTIGAIAEAARVSRSTASRVLADPAGTHHASAATRARILATAWRLGYRTAGAESPPAPALVGMLIRPGHPWTETHLSSVPELLLQQLDHHGYDLALLLDRDWQQWLARDRPRGFRGLIIPDWSSPAWDDLRPKLEGLPRILFNWEDESGEDAVLVNDAGGATLAAQHLLDLGHRRLLFVGPPSASGPLGCNPYINHRSLPIRRAAFAQTVVTGGGIFEEVSCDPPALFQILGTALPPTAIYLYGGSLLTVVLTALHQTHILIPENLSIVVGNDCPEAATHVPGITAVDVPYLAMAEQAVAMLVARMAGDQGPARRAELSEGLVMRASTGKPRRL